MTDLLALAERCEVATGPDRELDAAIAIALGMRRQYIVASRAWQFTASVDAALTLVPERVSWKITGGAVNSTARVFCLGGNESCIAATPALAICAASLRAIAAQESNQ